MAIANNTTAGTITFAGDLQGTFDVPELSPTGVVPGEYQGVSLVVDTKGRTIYARSMTEVDVPCATISSCGVVAIGDNITDEGAGLISIALATINSKGVIKVGSGFTINGCILDVDYDEATTTLDGVVIVPTAGNLDVDGSGNISVPLATDTVLGIIKAGNGVGVAPDGTLSVSGFDIATTSTLGVVIVPVNQGISVDGSGNIDTINAETSTLGIVKSADTDNITIFAGGVVNVGTNIGKKDAFTTWTKSQQHSLFSLGTTGSITPDLDESSVFEADLTGNITLNAPINGLANNNYTIIIKPNGFTVTFGSEYKIKSTLTTVNGISILSFVKIDSSNFYSILQTNYI